MPLLKPCLDCGELTDGVRCDEHRTKRVDRKISARLRGYDTAWTKLSLRARAMQPFCSVCGTGDDLTVDHSTTAWERHAARLPIRLSDVRVLCRSCNAKAGRARPGGEGSSASAGTHIAKAEFPSHTPRGIQ